MPDHLPLLKEGAIMVHIVSLNNIEDVVNDGGGGDRSFVVTIVVKEAVDEDVLERLTFDSIVLLESECLFGLVSGIPGQKG